MRVTVPLANVDRAGDVLIALRVEQIGIAGISVQKPSLGDY
jgi:hypothetical protein